MRNLEQFVGQADMAGFGSAAVIEPMPARNLSVVLCRLKLGGLVTAPANHRCTRFLPCVLNV